MTKKTNDIINFINELFPNAKCELNYFDDYSLLIAILLSAQTTDKKVNDVTKKLFLVYPNVFSLSDANISELVKILKPLGLANNKAKNILSLSKTVVENYDGKIPKTYDDLIKLSGIGNKSASVFLAEYYGLPFLAVDTHVLRVAKRLNLVSSNENPAKTQKLLENIFPKKLHIKMHHQLIFFGRYFCKAINPKCENCKLKKYCNYYKS